MISSKTYITLGGISPSPESTKRNNHENTRQAKKNAQISFGVNNHVKSVFEKGCGLKTFQR